MARLNVEIAVKLAGMPAQPFRPVSDSARVAAREVHDLDIQVRAVEKGMSLLRGALAFAGITSFGALIKLAVGEASEGQKVFSQLAAGVLSTGGAAGYTARQLADMATGFQNLTAYSDEAVAGAESLLLKFRSIRGDNFKEATARVLDLAQRMDGDLSGAAQQVGKLLEGNIAGATRMGIVFSAAEKQKLQDFVKTGHMIEYQTAVLAKLNQTVGGSAEAFRNTMPGAILAMRNQLGEFFQAIGDKFAPTVRRLAESLAQALQSKEFARAAATIGEILTALTEGLESSLAPALRSFGASLLAASQAGDFANLAREIGETVGGALGIVVRVSAVLADHIGLVKVALVAFVAVRAVEFLRPLATAMANNIATARSFVVQQIQAAQSQVAYNATLVQGSGVAGSYNVAALRTAATAAEVSAAVGKEIVVFVEFSGAAARAGVASALLARSQVAQLGAWGALTAAADYAAQGLVIYQGNALRASVAVAQLTARCLALTGAVQTQASMMGIVAGEQRLLGASTAQITLLLTGQTAATTSATAATVALAAAQKVMVATSAWLAKGWTDLRAVLGMPPQVAIAIAVAALAMKLYINKVEEAHRAMLAQLDLMNSTRTSINTMKTATDEILDAKTKELKATHLLTEAEGELVVAHLARLTAARDAAEANLKEKEDTLAKSHWYSYGRGKMPGEVADARGEFNSLNEQVNRTLRSIDKYSKAIQGLRRPAIDDDLGGGVDKARDRIEEMIAALRRQAEEKARLLSASAKGAKALADEELLIKQENAVRQAGSKIRTTEIAEVYALVKAISVSEEAFKALAAAKKAVESTDAKTIGAFITGIDAANLARIEESGKELLAQRQEGLALNHQYATDEERHAQAVAHANTLLEAGAITLRTYNEILRDNADVWVQTVSEVDRVTAALAEQIAVYTDQLADGITNVLIQGLKDGKVEAEDFWIVFRDAGLNALGDWLSAFLSESFKAMAAWLARWIATQAAAKAASASLGTGGSGSGGGTPQLLGMAGTGAGSASGSSSAVGGASSGLLAMGAVVAIFAAVYFAAKAYIGTQKKVFAQATLSLEADGHAAVNDIKGNGSRLVRITSALNAAAAGVIDFYKSLGAQVTGFEAALITVGRTGQGKKTDWWVKLADGFVRHFGADQEAAFNAAMIDAIQHAKTSGLSPLVAQAIKESTAQTVEEFQKAIEDATEIANLGRPQAAVALRQTIIHLDDLRAVLAKMNEVTPAVIQGFKDLTAAEAGAWQAWSDSITGRVQSAAELLAIKQREGEMFNAERAMRLADLALKKMALEAELAMIKARGAIVGGGLRPPGGGTPGGAPGGSQGPGVTDDPTGGIFAYSTAGAGLINAGLALGKLELEGKAALLKAESQLIVVELTLYEQTILLIQQQIDAISAIIAAMPGAIDIASIRIPRVGGGAGTAASGRDDIREQAKRWGMGDVTVQIADAQKQFDDFKKSLKGMGFSAKEQAALMGLAAAELARRLALLKAQVMKTAEDFIKRGTVFGGPLLAGMVEIDTAGGEALAGLRELMKAGKLSRAEFQRLADAIRDAAAAQKDAAVRDYGNALLSDLFGLLGMDKEAAQMKFDLSVAELQMRRQELEIAMRAYGLLDPALLAKLDGLIRDFIAHGPNFGDTTADITKGGKSERHYREAADDLSGAASAQKDAAERLRRAVDGLLEYQRSLRTDTTLGLVNSRQALANAQASYESIRARAAGGDVSAMEQFQAAAATYLKNLKDFSPSSGLLSQVAGDVDAMISYIAARYGSPGQAYNVGNVVYGAPFGEDGSAGRSGNSSDTATQNGIATEATLHSLVLEVAGGRADQRIRMDRLTAAVEAILVEDRRQGGRLDLVWSRAVGE